MGVSHLTPPVYPSIAAATTVPQQHGVFLNGDEHRRKRRAVDVDPVGWSRNSPAYHRSPMSRFSDGRSFEEFQESAKKLKGAHEDYIPMILNRLATVERELGIRKLSPGGSSNDPQIHDMVSMRSMPSPLAQGNVGSPINSQLAADEGGTPTYNDQERLPEASFTDALSLRTDLNSQGVPPFGVWWASTIEEILVWPILGFSGDVNGSLDALMDSSDEDDDESEDDGSPNSNRSSLCRKIERSKANRVRKGLDNANMVAQFLDSFLRNVHVKNPVLDTSQLRSYASNLVENGLSFDGETCQVLLVCALGAISNPWDTTQIHTFSGPRTPSERFSIAQEYFDAAQKRLGGLWAHSSLISAQCLFLTGVFFMYCQQPVSGWRAFNSASIACRSYISKRKAQQKKSVLKTNSRNLEERLCWSCFKSESEIACQIGIETWGLNLLTNPTSLPTPPNGYAWDINQPPSNAAQNMTPAPSPNLNVLDEVYEDQSRHYFLAETVLYQFQMHIDTYSHDKRREAYRRVGEQPESFFRSMVEILRGFNHELTNYYKTLPPILQFPLSDLTPCSDELRNNLRWRLFGVKHDINVTALYILLHFDVSQWQRPLVAELVEMANACLKLNTNLLRIAISSHRSQTTWLAIRAGVRSALILMAGDKLAAQHLPELEKLYVPDRATCDDGSRALVKGLQYWSAESKDCALYLDVLQQLDPVFRTFA